MKILQITGYKNTGKTTLINRLVTYLKSLDYQVAVIKHHHQSFADETDTGQFIQKGADMTILNTPSASMKVVNKQPQLETQLAELDGIVDFILIEGYKDKNYPKIYLEYSFTGGTTSLNALSLKSVLMTFDMRYDEDKVMEWFKSWSENG
jgi:molybdopterin-guanine dinucleotide biosynthesis protein B